MALSAARNTITARTRYGDTLRIPVAEGHVIYLGGLVCVNAYGYAVPAADIADYKFAGIAMNDPQDPTAAQSGKYDNTDGSDGDIEVVVRWAGRAREHLALRTPSADMRFAKVYVYDDATVAVHRYDVANDVRCGHIIRVPSDVSSAHKDVRLDSDEVEIEFSGEPFDWDGGVSTTAAPTTTTTTGRIL